MINHNSGYISAVLLISLLTLLGNGCSERESFVIDAELDSSDPILVAHGMIEEDANAYINLSHTRDVDDAEPVYIENALVTLSVSDGNSEVLDYVGSGLYEGDTIIGEVDKSYTLEIRIDDRTWSATSTILSHLVIDTAYAEIVSGGKGGSGSKDAGGENTSGKGETSGGKDGNGGKDTGGENTSGKGETSGKDDGGQGSYYTPVWHVADDPNTRDYFLFRFFINGTYAPTLTWDYDDGRGINTSGYHALIHPRLFLPLTDTLVIKASRIDLPTYHFYNQFERLIVSGGATGAITPYNPASNFGEGVVGYFMAISSVSVEIVPEGPGSTPTPGNTPRNVTVTAGTGEITISWDSVDGADSYSISWVVAHGDGSKEEEKVITGILSSPYTHRGLQKGVTYYYRVAANIGTEVYVSGWVSATPN